MITLLNSHPIASANNMEIEVREHDNGTLHLVIWTPDPHSVEISQDNLRMFAMDVLLETSSSSKAELEYLENLGLICPICGSHNLDGMEINIDAGGATQEIQCGHCQSMWLDCYSLTGICNLVDGRDNSEDDTPEPFDDDDSVLIGKTANVVGWGTESEHLEPRDA